jgi:UDP:flavonoid glycosyltransferase YjiC (YdhE family)
MTITKPKQKLRIAVSTMPANAGETTRAVEICRSMRDQATASNLDVEIKFFATLYSPDKRVSFDHFITDAGFELELIGPGYAPSERKALFDREHSQDEFFQGPEEKRRAVDAIRGTTAALKKFYPTIVLYGFSYDMAAQIAAKILSIPSALYLPLPTDMNFLNEVIYDDLPSDIQAKGFWLLPKAVRQKILHHVISSPNTASNQPTLRAAAIEAGWVKEKKEGKTVWLWDILESDIVLVNDLPGNYSGYDLPESTVITGPVFPFDDDNSSEIPNDILRVFDPSDDKNTKIFVAMGSSGHKKHLVEANKAASRSTPNGSVYSVVALVPHTIGSVEEIQAEVFGSDPIPGRVYLTDAFVPAKQVNKLADIAIVHGGQGTVQTAMGAGTPIVSVGLQPEQVINIRQVERRGAGIKLERRQWTEANISGAIERIVADGSYHECARSVKKEMDLCDGSGTSAQALLALAMRQTQ